VAAVANLLALAALNQFLSFELLRKQLPFGPKGRNECAIGLPEWLARSRGAGSICKITFAIREIN